MPRKNLHEMRAIALRVFGDNLRKDWRRDDQEGNPTIETEDGFEIVVGDVTAIEIAELCSRAETNLVRIRGTFEQCDGLTLDVTLGVTWGDG